MTKRVELVTEKTMNIIDNSTNKMEHVNILLDLIKSSEKEGVLDFSKNLINFYKCLSKNKEEAAQLTIKTLISIIGSDKKINNTEEKISNKKTSNKTVIKEKTFLMAVNSSNNENNNENNKLIKKVNEVVKKDTNIVEVNGSIYKKEEDSKIIISSYIKSSKIYSVIGFTELNVSSNSFTVPQLNMYSLKNSGKTSELEKKIENRKLEPITLSTGKMNVVVYDEFVPTNEVFITPFSNYPKGIIENHRFLSVYDNDFSFSKTEIYDKYHTSITPGFVSSIEPIGRLWKIGIKYIYAKQNNSIHTKFIHCLISDKVKKNENYNINLGTILITGNIVCHNNKTGSDKNAYCTSMILALGHDAAEIMRNLKKFKEDLNESDKYKTFLSDVKNKFKLEKWLLPFDNIFEEVKVKKINVKNKEMNEGSINVEFKGKDLEFDFKDIFNFGKNQNDFKNERKKKKFLNDINNIRNLNFRISSIEGQSYFLNYY